jgi:phospholipase C
VKEVHLIARLGGIRIGQGSFDGIANSIAQIFDFKRRRESGTLFLNPSTGQLQGHH